jgi:dTDP-4-amino-4,6-dideoxygalactose transaminase
MYPTWTITEPSAFLPLEDITDRLMPLLHEIMELDRQIIASGKYVYGPYTTRLEAALKQAWHLPGQVVLTKSGSDALILATWAAGLDSGIASGEEVEVIVPNLTFPSSATSVTIAGALRYHRYTVVLVDVDPRTLNLDPLAVEAAITEHTRAVIVPHLYGNPAPMDRILALAQQHQLTVIEDTSQAHGARLHEQSVGTFGQVAAGSLYAYKGLGGMGDLGYVIVPEQAYAQALRDRDLGRDMGHRDTFHSLGLRSRPEEKSAGVALLHLPHLDQWNARCRQIVAYYREGLLDTPIQMPEVVDGALPAYWRCTLLVPQAEVREPFRQFLAAQGIGTEVVYPHLVSAHGMYLHGAGAYPCRLPEGGTPHAEDATRCLVCIPCFAQLSDTQVEQVAQAVRAFFVHRRNP